MQFVALKTACLFQKTTKECTVHKQKTKRQGWFCADYTAKQCVLNIIIPLTYMAVELYIAIF